MITTVGRLFLLLFPLSVFASDIALRLTSMDGVPLLEAGAEQPFLLHVTVTNSPNATHYPIIKNSENFQIRNSGFQMNMANGTTTATYHYQVRIDTPGSYTLGPAQLGDGTGTASSPIRVTVGQQQKTQETKKSSSVTKSFLQLAAEPQRVVVGQKIHCTLTFYTPDQGVSLQALIEPDAATTPNFIIKDKEGPATGNQIINGVEHRYAQWQWDIYPNKPGTVTIPAYATDFIQAAQTRMFSFFFAQNETKRVYSNVIQIAVDPLPESHKKNQFIGTIESFEATIEPSTAKVGEGAVLTLKITGDGDFDQLSGLVLHDMPTPLKWYESKQYKQSASTLANRSIMEYIVQALQPGTHTIPSQEFSYFDTRDRAYKTTKTKALTLRAVPGASSSTAHLPQKEITAPSGQQSADDIRPLHHEGPWNVPVSNAIIPWPLFALLLILAATAWFFHLLWISKNSWLYRISLGWSSNTSLYTRTRDQIKRAHAMRNYAAFYPIFINFFSEKTGAAAATLSPEIIDQFLLDSGLSMQAVDDWRIFFSKISEIRFYNKAQDPYVYSSITEQALYWIDVFEKMNKGVR